MSKYARKQDGNHAEIRDGLRGCGVPVFDTHGLPGALDLLIRKQSGELALLEIKADEREQLTEREAQTFDLFPGCCYKVWTLQQAIDIAFER